MPTAPTGTVIDGGTFVGPVALGDKIIHPLSDLLVHNAGTGDGIVQNGARLAHDGATTVSRPDAINRHVDEAMTWSPPCCALVSQQSDVINS